MMYLGEGSRDIYVVECSRSIYISDNLGEPNRDTGVVQLQLDISAN